MPALAAEPHRDAVEYTPRERWSPQRTWDREGIVAALRDWTGLLGRPPRSYEWTAGAGAARSPTPGCRIWRVGHPRWPSTPTVVRHFGSWNAALEAAGLPLWRPSAPPAEGRDERIRIAQRLAARGMSSPEIAGLIGVAPRTVRAYVNAGRCVGCGGYVVTTRRCPSCAARHARPPERSRADVLTALRAWARETGRPPTQADWTPSTDRGSRWAREYPRWPSFMTVTTLFGSWRAALEAAGLRPNHRLWTRSEIAAALARWTADRGRPPRQGELAYGAAGMPTTSTIRKHFGSYAAALEAAAIEPRRRFWSEDRIVAAMRAWAECHGRPPTSCDWTRSGGEHPHATTVRQRFGTWEAAASAAFGPGHAICD
jgi:hypothetical protein